MEPKRFVRWTCGALLLLAPAAAHGGQPFVDAPVSLPLGRLSADLGLGAGTYQSPAGGTNGGTGGSLDAAFGLPFFGELGIRAGARFGQDGVLVGGVGSAPGYGADHFAHLFDPIFGEPGRDQLSNLELHDRGTLLGLEVFQLALETRLVIPTAAGSSLDLIPGLPMRVHVPGFLRVDTGAWLPILFASDATVLTLDVPVQAFFQVGDAFFGPLTGLRFDDVGAATPAGTSVDVPLGVGAGYTFLGILDVKAQVRTERVNDSAWASRYLGGGVGIGVRTP